MTNAPPITNTQNNVNIPKNTTQNSNPNISKEDDMFSGMLDQAKEQFGKAAQELISGLKG